MGLPIGPVQLLEYFERMNDKYPREHLRNGAEMCRRWQSLLNTPLSQADIDLFVARLEAEMEYGSGWQDLQLQFCHWAREQGFRA